MTVFDVILLTVVVVLAISLIKTNKSLRANEGVVSEQQRVIRELSILNELSASLHTSLDKGSVLEMIIEKARSLLRAEDAAILLINQGRRVTDFYTTTGPSNGCKTRLTGVFKRVITELITIRTDDISSLSDFSGVPPEHPRIRSVLMVPVILRGEPIGIVAAINKKDGSFDSNDEDLILNLAFHSALAIEKVKFHEEILRMASTDGLTGLNNHRTFQERLEQEIERARRFDVPLSLLMMEIDQFKKFNDTYGHTNGDEVLKVIAKILKDNVRNIDFVARYGGEEFAVILPQVNLEGALVVAERIRKAAEDYELNLDGQRERVTLSVGVATYPDDASTREELVDHADKALYLAKRTGRNRLCSFREGNGDK